MTKIKAEHLNNQTERCLPCREKCGTHILLCNVCIENYWPCPRCYNVDLSYLSHDVCDICFQTLMAQTKKV